MTPADRLAVARRDVDAAHAAVNVALVTLSEARAALVAAAADIDRADALAYDAAHLKGGRS